MSPMRTFYSSTCFDVPGITGLDAKGLRRLSSESISISRYSAIRTVVVYRANQHNRFPDRSSVRIPVAVRWETGFTLVLRITAANRLHLYVEIRTSVRLSIFHGCRWSMRGRHFPFDIITTTLSLTRVQASTSSLAYSPFCIACIWSLST